MNKAQQIFNKLSQLRRAPEKPFVPSKRVGKNANKNIGKDTAISKDVFDKAMAYKKGKIDSKSETAVAAMPEDLSKKAQATFQKLTQKELGVKPNPVQDISRTETHGSVTFKRGDNTQKKRDIVSQLSKGVTDNPKVQAVIESNWENATVNTDSTFLPGEMLPDVERKLVSVKNSIKHNNPAHHWLTGDPNEDASRARTEDPLTGKKSVTNAIGRDSKRDDDVKYNSSLYFSNPSPTYRDLK